MLLVLNSARALNPAAKRVWDQNAVVQRCRSTRSGNLKANVPQKHHAELERRLSGAYQEVSYETAKASLESTARWLDRINLDAAPSLREGLVPAPASRASI